VAIEDVDEGDVWLLARRQTINVVGARFLLVFNEDSLRVNPDVANYFKTPFSFSHACGR
jgi:hypothetical protein